MDHFIESLNLKNIVLVMHGWGSIIGFDYAMRHEANCKGLVCYEAFLRSLNSDDFSLPFQEQLNILAVHEDLNDVTRSGVSFIDEIIPQTVMRQLTDEEMHHYREPFMQKGSSLPILQYINELINEEQKHKIDQLIANYSQKLMRSALPKLMLYSVPGFVTSIATIMWAKENLPQLELIDIGEELHLA